MRLARIYFKFIAVVLATVIFSVVFTVFNFTPKTNAVAGINRTINFQGKLVNNPAKTNVSNTSYTVVFTFYDRASGGTALWTETQTVNTSDGIFRVSLGSVTPFPVDFNFNWDGLYLGMKVNADSEMSPRIQMSAVPFAFNAERVAGLTVQDDAGNASTSATLRIANDKTVTISNGLTFAGIDGTTITFQGSDTYVGKATTDVLTNKSIGNTGLIFSGATTDLTTGTDEDFTLIPNGSGNLILGGDSDSGITIGSGISKEFPLLVRSGISNTAAFVVDNLNLGDLFSASSSGTTKFTLGKNGEIGLGLSAGLPNFGSASSCLLSGGTGSSASWGTCGGGTNYWALSDDTKAVTLANNSMDLLIGGSATNSAKFAVLNLAGGIPTATVSGNFTIMPNNGAGGTLSIGKTSALASLDIKDTNSTAVVGSEKITNSNDRDFTSDTGSWTTSGSPAWKINIASSGLAAKNAPGTGAITLSNSALDLAPVAGNYYLVTFSYTTTSTSSGNLTSNFGGTNGRTVGQDTSMSKTETDLILATNTNALIFSPTSGWYGTIDDVSIKQVTKSSIALRLEASDGNGKIEFRTGYGFGSDLFIGDSAGSSNVAGGSSNTGVGWSALASNTSGFANTAFGSSTLSRNTTGNLNVAIGSAALLTNTIGQGNIAVGSNALSTNVSGDNNTGIGAFSLNNVTSGGYNIALGRDSGNSITTGSYNTALGYSSNVSTGSLTNAAAIGAYSFVSQSNSLILGSINGVNSATASTLVGIGTTAPLATLDVRGSNGTLNVASFSGRTSFASLLVSNDGVGDLFTASSSGFTRFKIGNYGQVSAASAISSTENILGTSSASLISAFKGYQGYTNFSGGIGTGGVDSIISTQRITSAGNLTNIGSIQAGETLLTYGATLSAKVDYTTGSNPLGIAIGDLNGDGKADMAVTNSTSGIVSVFINKGDGTFSARQDYNTSSGPNTVVIGDLNGDGKADLATANQSAGNVSVLINKGDGTFALKQDYTTNTGSFSVAMGDINGDGKPDLATANNGTTNVSVLINNGNGNFATHQDYSVAGAPRSVAMGDLNGDGKVDMAVTGSNTTVAVFLNNGNGAFNPRQDYATNPNVYAIAIGDLNGDGKADLVTGNQATASISVFINSGNGTFGPKQDAVAGNTPRFVAIGDLNGDGKADVAVTNQGGANVSVFLNQSNPIFYASANSGRVGIGTNNPLAVFDVRADTASNSGTLAVASISGQTSFASLVLNNSGSGDLFTASKSGATKFVINNNGNLQFAGTTNFLSTITSAAASSQTWTLPNASGTICTSANNCSADQYWQLNTNALSPGNSTYDVLFGGNATSSAKFSLVGLAGTSPIASLSAQNAANSAIYLDAANGTISTVRNATLTLGGGSSGNVLINPLGAAQFGMGTSSPIGTFDLRYAAGTNIGGTTSVASISGKTSFAALVINNSGSGDVLAASSSGKSLFTITQNAAIFNTDTISASNTAKLTNNGSPVTINALGDQGSLIPNSSFEASTSAGLNFADGWVISATTAASVRVDTSNSFHGDRSAKIQITNNRSVFYSPCVPISSTTNNYNLGYATMVPTGAQIPTVRVYVEFFTSKDNCANNARLAVSTPVSTTALAANSTWTAVTPANIATGGTTSKWARISIFAQAGSTNATAYIDAITFDSATTTTGLDLAENYQGDPDNLAEPGDVVKLTQLNGKTVVVPADKANDKSVIGVVTTKPGMVLDDSNVEEPKIAVALAGRIPTKVSTINGEIKVGDELSSSTTPGVAVKAIKSGQIIGTAMEDYSDGNNIGVVTMFIKNGYSDYNFVSIEDTKDLSKLDTSSSTFSQDALTQLISQNDQGLTGSAVVTDRLISTIEIVTPKMTVDTLVANNIQAAHIDGLEMINDRLSALEEKVATMSANLSSVKVEVEYASSSAKSAEDEAKLDLQNKLMETLTSQLQMASKSSTLTQDSTAIDTPAAGSLRVKGNALVEGILNVVDTLTANNFIVNSLATFFGDAIFKAKVAFEGPVTFNNDSGGNAVIKKGADRVEVVFDEEFEDNPIINTSVSFDEEKDSNGNIIPSDDVEKNYFKQNYSYIIVDKSKKGFTIVLNRKAGNDVTFTWTAMRIKDAKTIQSRVESP